MPPAELVGRDRFSEHELSRYARLPTAHETRSSFRRSPFGARIAYALAGMRRAAFVAAAVVLVVSGKARAETRSLHIEYQAAPSCPDEHRFVELARDRVREWPTIAEHGDLIARVRTEKQDAAFVGRMSLEDAAGRSLGAREIQEADCEDVVRALALFLAVALEADAESHARFQTSAPVEPPSEAPAPAPPPPAHAPVIAPPPPPPSPPRDDSAMTWQAFVRAHGMTGRMPDPAPGAALGIELGSRRAASILRPFGSLGIDAAPNTTRREGRGRVELGWGTLFGRACLGFDLRTRARRQDDPLFEPWVCGRAEGGRLQAASRGYVTNRTETLAWYAVGPEAGLSVRLSQVVSVGTFAHAMFPLVRHELVLHEAPLFRAPWIAGEAGLEVKVRIW